MKQEEMSLGDYHKLGNASRPAGRRKGQTPEGIVLSSCMRYLSYLPERVYAVRTNSGVMFDDKGHRIRLAPAGTSDITGYIRLSLPPFGRHIARVQIAAFFACECKATEKDEPTDLQQVYLDGVRRAGGFAVVAWSSAVLQTALERFIEEMEGR